MTNNQKVREPLFHIAKRAPLPVWESILIRVIAIIAGLLVGGLLYLIVYGKSPIQFIVYLVEGNFKPAVRIVDLLRGTCILLGVGLALIPAFKMKFWNLGGNGQILIGALVTTACMFYLGDKVPSGLLWVIMLVSAIIAGAIWGVIPAIFKAYFNTNESLFTLMMNYIATGLVAFAIKEWGGKASSGMLAPMFDKMIPKIAGSDATLVIIIVAILAVFMTIYMKYSKQGYEISVVGDSERTARYVGINVKKVIIRTMAISGAICGIIGFLYSGVLSGTVSVNTAQNMGFVAIIAVWIANMDPLITIISSTGIMFLTYGLNRVQQNFGVYNDSVSNMIIGLMYLIIIACVFFTTYKVIFRKKTKKSLDMQGESQAKQEKGE